MDLKSLRRNSELLRLLGSLIKEMPTLKNKIQMSLSISTLSESEKDQIIEWINVLEIQKEIEEALGG